MREREGESEREREREKEGRERKSEMHTDVSYRRDESEIIDNCHKIDSNHATLPFYGLC